MPGICKVKEQNVQGTIRNNLEHPLNRQMILCLHDLIFGLPEGQAHVPSKGKGRRGRKKRGEKEEEKRRGREREEERVVIFIFDSATNHYLF